MRMTTFVRKDRGVSKSLINTPLQRGDRESHRTATALAVFEWCEKTAEAVRIRVAARNHPAEAGC